MILTSLLILGNLVCLVFYYKRIRLRGEPPLVNEVIPYVGRALEFGWNPMGFLQKMQKEHGDVFTVKIAGWDDHVIMNPLDIVNLAKCKTLKQDSVIGEFVHKMIGTQHSIHNQMSRDYDSQQRNDAVAKAMIENLRGFRQIRNLYRSTLHVTVDTVKMLLNEKIEYRNGDNTVNLHDLCKDLIFYNTYYVLLGILPNEEEDFKQAKALYKHFMTFNDGIALLIDRVPMHLLRKTKQAREEILKMLSKIDLRKRDYVSDLIAEVIHADNIEEHRIRHLLVFMWTGQANTSPGLFWALYYILKNPEIQYKIMEEFQALVESKRHESVDPDEVNNNTPKRNVSLNDILNLERKDVDGLKLLDAVLKEVMRINGHNLNFRKATEDTVFTTHDGKRFNFRKGDHVMYYSPIMHMDPEVFNEPEKFIYDRFLEKKISTDEENVSEEEFSLTQPHFSKNGRRISTSRSILTFGFGEGKCPGRYLAFLEIKLLTLSFLTCFDATLIGDKIPEKDVSFIGFGVLPPKEDISISLTKKKV